MTPPHPRSLLGLPRELRDMIYAYVFDNLMALTSRENIKFLEIPSSQPRVPLTQSCRQIRAETLARYREILAGHWKDKVFWFSAVRDGWPAGMLGEFGDASRDRSLRPIVRRLEQMSRVVVRTRDCTGRECLITLRRNSRGGGIQARTICGSGWLLPTSTMLDSLEFVW